MTPRIVFLLRHAHPGASATVRGHLQRARVIHDAITERWHLQDCWSWKAKHLRWFLATQLEERALATQRDYWRTVRAILAVLGKQADWEPHLRGPWNAASGPGGRPPKLARKFSRLGAGPVRVRRAQW